MAVNENDIDLLLDYLDRELPVSDCEGLWRRLAVETDLAAELERLRADAALRGQVWSSLEPDDQTDRILQTSILRAAWRDDWMSGVRRILRVGIAAAACILFGFTVGWFGRDSRLALPASGVQVLSNSDGTAGHGAGKYVVDVRDDTGRTVAAPQFDSFEEARRFADDVARYQAGRQESHDSTVVPAMDRF
jgi:anti-sigma factor RsiW